MTKRALLAVTATFLLIPIVSGVARAQDDGGSSGPRHRRCGWIGAGDLDGAAVFAANASWYDAIHPDWYAIANDSVAVRPLATADNSTVLDAAAANGVQVIPLVAGVSSVSLVRTMLADPGRRAQHVQNLVDLAVQHGYDGLDIDYEHLWQASDRVLFQAFMADLADALHAAGKSLSAALPALDHDSLNSAYDYTFLSSVLDQVHIMGYDLHTVGTHEGPTAPLGWLQAVAAHAAATGNAPTFILGLPNYGITSTWFCANASCVDACGGAYDATTDHMQSCAYGDWDAGRSPNCWTAQGHLYFEDTASLEEKVLAAASAGLGGITYWTVGSEPDGFFDMVRSYY